VADGFLAGLLDGDPLSDLSGRQAQRAHIPMKLEGGVAAKDRFAT
jgi:hypothetical protein